MPPPDLKPSFLSLPSELRLRIYAYVFPHKPQITPYLKQPSDLSIASSTLRTCKKFHTEASTILYSKNTFLISTPQLVQKWLRAIGRLNTTLLRNVRIWIDPVYESDRTLTTGAKNCSLWFKVLHRLAVAATGLQCVDVVWDAEPSGSRFGAGMEMQFLGELARIRGVNSIVVGGFYGMHWPRYLRGRGGGVVLEKRDTQSELEYRRR